jgi:hypothetical protein
MLAIYILLISIPVFFILGVVYLVARVTNKNGAESMISPSEFGVESGIFLSLISSVAALISIVFAAIDKKFPDVLTSNYYVNSAMNNDIRMAIAILLVAFPLYLALAYSRAKYFEKNTSRRNIASLKWPHYITLFVCVVTIVISLAMTIYYYLGGELVARFALKMLTVFAVVSGLAGYNYFLIGRDYAKKTIAPMVFSIIAVILVLGSVVYSINILGSPAEVRKMRFDEKRLEDLSNIQQSILSFWQKNKVLPADLVALYSDGMNSGIIVPKDPDTKVAYTYKVVENSKMTKAKGQDCANFYPGKFGSYSQGGTYDISKLICDIPTKATFQVCATFETVRIYDENGIDQSSNAGFDYKSPMYSSYNSDVGAIYYRGGDTKNPNWNHEAGNYCFERVIDPNKYPSYY